MLDGLTQEQSNQVDAILTDLLVRAEAEAVYLCDRGGNILAENTITAYDNDDNIAALAAGSFFATRELARLVGEPEFKSAFHQGDKKSMYMQNTDNDLLVVVLFGKESNPGITKLFTDKACGALDRYLSVQVTQDTFELSMEGMALEIDETSQPFRRISRTDPS